MSPFLEMIPWAFSYVKDKKAAQSGFNLDLKGTDIDNDRAWEGLER